MALSELEKAVINGMARAFFVSAWMDRQEDIGESLSGVDGMDVAPDTPEDVTMFAALFAGQLINENGASLVTILYAAAKADGIDTDAKYGEDGACFWEAEENRWNNYAQEFGHCAAMEGMGHGVSWSDDHEEFTLYGFPEKAFKVPHTEFTMFDID